MAKTITEKINGFGVSLRFILPIMVGIFFTFMLRNFDSLEKNIDELKLHFSNHLSHHERETKATTQFRMDIVERLSKIEVKMEK